jgi:hypothetical protein
MFRITVPHIAEIVAESQEANYLVPFGVLDILVVGTAA